VVLATGDPLCHGIASFLSKKISTEKLDIMPNISSIQLAFACIGMAWQDAKTGHLSLKPRPFVAQLKRY
jgi:precorrin-6Y C5,15-methyltransferase (decarboxylating)